MIRRSANPAPQAPGTPDPSRYYAPDPGLSIRDYVRVVRERMWILVLCVAIAAGIAVLRCIDAVPTYIATARLQIDPLLPRIKGIENPAESSQSFYGYWGFKEYFSTQIENLKSPALREQVIAQPDVQEALREYWDTHDAARPNLLQRLLYRSGWEAPHRPPPTNSDGMLLPPPINVRVSALKETRLVDLMVEAEDPGLAAMFANETTVEFQQENLQQRMERSNEALEWLAQRARELEEQVGDAEMALQDYKARENSVALEDANDIISAELEQLNSAVTQAKTERISAERTYEQIRRLLEDENNIEKLPTAFAVSGGFTAVMAEMDAKRAELAQLRERYLEMHPRVVTAEAEVRALREHLRAEAESLLETARADYDLARSREEGLQAALEEQEKEALLLDRKAVEYGILKRQAETTRTLYSSILQRMEEASVAGTVEANNITLVKLATPPGGPAKPNKPRILIGFTAFGFAVGIGLILLVNVVDDRIRSQEDVENNLRIPFLGYIPQIPGRSPLKRDRAVLDDPKSTTAEAFRSLRAAIGFADEEGSFHTILLTSASPGEGKSLVASNLAIAYAQTGMRTLLVDADMRRPSVHYIFGVEKGVGLSTYLTSQRSVGAVCSSAPGVDNLDVCPAGGPVPNPAELLTTDEMDAFIREATERYDRIIFDTPPVSAVSDPLLLSSRVDSVILVTQFKRLRTPLVKRTVRRLVDAHARITGGVINRIDVRPGSANYYYYYGYYDDYYYGDDGERRRRSRKGRRKKSKATGHARRAGPGGNGGGDATDGSPPGTDGKRIAAATPESEPVETPTD